ncbi:MAG: hypothetical protein QOC77_2035 [Thermoleophilaceae bacterium]|jgi:hypothetical protein|nr:hypothetical protein [Thermoleophilaceae bacterium]MEA2469437.1 hypothetical protein [Thermoleophilaceae bacterium]
MATLDQLPAEQRAIVELVVQRGRSYGALAEVLQVPAERVRELARDALTELSPRTAARVDAGWRGQIADYLLGQQPADEARSTRDYLKRSEPARAWALSLLDSLDPLYPNGAAPAVPEPGVKDEAAAVTAEDRIRERARKLPPVVQEKVKAVEPEEEPKAVDKPKAEPEREPAMLSPEAQSAMRRRRIVGVVAALAVLAAITVGILAIAGVFSSDNKSSPAASTGTTPTGTGTTTTAQPPIQVLGQIALLPINKSKAQGVAYLVSQGSQKFVVVQAQVPPLPNSQKVAAYEVWLYNTNGDARSLGAQYTNTQGILQGRAPLPADYQKFKAIDISRELFSDKNAGHGNDSVLRGAFATLRPVPPQTPGTGTSTTPAP